MMLEKINICILEKINICITGNHKTDNNFLKNDNLSGANDDNYEETSKM